MVHCRRKQDLDRRFDSQCFSQTSNVLIGPSSSTVDFEPICYRLLLNSRQAPSTNSKGPIGSPASLLLHGCDHDHDFLSDRDYDDRDHLPSRYDLGLDLDF